MVPKQNSRQYGRGDAAVQRVTPGGRVWLCLLLAALFLYNPFATAPSSSLGLNVQESASHRATVGASELQQFTATERHAPAIQIISPVSALLLAHAPALERFTPPDLAAPRPQTDWPASMRFRPPPA